MDEKGAPLELATSAEQIRRLVTASLAQLEAPGGLAATARASVESAPRPAPRQWDYPFGWAPHQILAWDGLRRQGYPAEARRLAYRWLYMISKNAHDFHGTVPEKFDVVRRSHEVFAEYGNVGSDFRYITREGFGWMNASFQLGRQLLPAELWDQLLRLVPPEAIAEFQ
jgi:alpha,alpha-trehalase